MPIGGGDEVQVIPSLFRYNVAVTATGVYYDTLSRDTPSSIEYLDFATGKVTTLYTLAKPVDLGLTVSPDGRFLLFAQNDFLRKRSDAGGQLLVVRQDDAAPRQSHR